MLKISGLGRNPLENPSCLPHCKVGPGTFERKDVSIGPQHLSKRRNLSTYSFARGPKFGREESADDVSWFTERVFEPWFEAWPWGPWWRWNWHAWLGDSIVRLFFLGAQESQGAVPLVVPRCMRTNRSIKMGLLIMKHVMLIGRIIES
jgi:hypothetical protein